VLVIYGLVRPADREVASAFIGKPLPGFDLRRRWTTAPAWRSPTSDGKPRLLNVFASWCVPWRGGIAAARRAGAAGRGDRRRRDPRPARGLAQFLSANGNPFRRIGKDDLSKVQLAIGSSGVPETFVIDGKGVIRYQHIGDIRAEDVPLILRKLKEAES
jgi:cytochrome c biogenesis protein CcmG/thiol:disulfide interchange protein DsbE